MAKYRTLATLLALPLGFAVAAASAQELTKEELASRLNGITAADITDAPIPGMYEVAVGANVAYVTKDGRYIIRGDIIDVETSANVSEETRARARATMLGSVDPASMIVFKPANGAVKHTITIFTDVDCGYCRQFHREIDKVTALGIEVHYLFYPRTGPNTESWTKADEVWCAAERNSALTRAKLGGSLPDAPACSTPVADHFELGQRIGVRGTPAIFNEAGDLIGGYLPPATLAKVLDDPDALIE
ncbi:MAG TPA: DsbC family protein [Gammaproteobacteria bacterium]|nr:DsbC family protein [Gammaproteobacteria bacterium]